MMTVAELRSALNDLPDDATIRVHCCSGDKLSEIEYYSDEHIVVMAG